MTRLVVGLDGGGTQTRALAATPGAVAGRGAGGPCNVAAVSVLEAFQSAREAAWMALSGVGAAPNDVGAVCAGVAGCSFEDRRRAFAQGLQALFPNSRVSVVPDYAIALAGATNNAPGVIVIAGTGSAAFGESASGETHKAGAYGYLIDDAGSGYGVGRLALAAVLRAADGTGGETCLRGRVLECLGLTSVADIVPGVYGGRIDRLAIAALSQVVAHAATEENDTVARTILMRAGGGLAQLAHGVTARLFSDASEAFPVVPIGGLWNAGPVLSDVFARSLQRFAPQAVIATPLSSPVEGAVQRALGML